MLERCSYVRVFFRHYDPVVQRYVVFDDGSTDQSLELLRSNPKVELRAMPEPSDPSSYVASGVALFDQCWKESRGRADWVILTDIDEHLYHPQLQDYLAHCARHGVSAVPALGYQMLAEKFPPESCLLSEACTIGAPYPPMSKLNIFSPARIKKPSSNPDGIASICGAMWLFPPATNFFCSTTNIWRLKTRCSDINNIVQGESPEMSRWVGASNMRGRSRNCARRGINAQPSLLMFQIRV
jgi:Glycosyl transferase family 2